MKKTKRIFIMFGIMIVLLTGCSNSNNNYNIESYSEIEKVAVKYLVTIATNCTDHKYMGEKCLYNPHSIEIYNVYGYDADSAGNNTGYHPYGFAFNLKITDKNGNEVEKYCGTKSPYYVYYDEENDKALFRSGTSKEYYDYPLLSASNYWDCDNESELSAIKYGTKLDKDKIYQAYLKSLDE